MPLNPNIALQTQTPNLLQALRSGYEAGQQIRQGPLMQSLLEQRVASGQQGLEAEAQRQAMSEAQSQRTGTQFEQQQAVQRAQYANSLARQLKSVPFENRSQILQKNADTLQSFGIDPQQLNPTDENLDQTILGTNPFIQQDVSAQTVQSAVNLPGGITKFLLRDGSVVVKDASNRIIRGQAAEDMVKAAERREAELAGFKAERVQTGKEATEGGRLTIDKAKYEMKQRVKAAQQKSVGNQSDVNAALVALDDLADGSYRKIYGKADALLPDLLRSQDALDSMALRDQVIGLISLESREKLKGQGTITDSEAKTLEKSATILANPNISDNLALRELKRVRSIFRGKKIEEATIAPSTGIKFLGFE